MVRRTFFRSWVPQNWERNTDAPELMPKSTSVSRKKIWFAPPAAATASSPSTPIITTSMRLTAEEMKNCMAMGMAVRHTVRINWGSKARRKRSFIIAFR